MNRFIEKIQNKTTFTGYLYLATIGLNLIYICFKIYQSSSLTVWTNLLFAAGSLLSYGLLVKGRKALSKFSFVLFSHFSIFFAQILGPSTSSTGVYFIVLILLTQIIFEYNQRFVALGLNLLSLTLCIVSVVINSGNKFDQSYILGSSILNFSIASIVTAISFLFVSYNQHLTHLKLIDGKESISKNLDEIKKTNAELDKFVYSVSHDIRAPLTSILGLVNIAKFSNSETELRELIKKIGYSAQSLSKFTSNILDYSRNSRLGVVRHNVHLKRLLNEVQTDQFLADTSAHHVQLHTNFESDLSFSCDYYRLKIILSNLYSNSVKYRDDSKEHSFIMIDAKKTEEFVTITYADNGIGILPERLVNIFNMFYRGTELSKGSGLGLYILKEAIEKLNGAVSVSAEPGQGTIFKIVIPIEESANVPSINP